MQVEEAYVAFLEHQNELQMLEQVAQKTEDIANLWLHHDTDISCPLLLITNQWHHLHLEPIARPDINSTFKIGLHNPYPSNPTARTPNEPHLQVSENRSTKMSPSSFQ
jgi:hypothetical protein